MNLSKEQFVKINGETIFIVVLHGNNRNEEVLSWQKKVMVDHFKLIVNYFVCPFPAVSHGWCMNQIIKDTIDHENAPDYYLFIDNDAIFLKENALDFIYQMVSNKITVFGHAWMNNHKTKPRGVVHAYASQATLCFSKQLYNALGRPDCDHFNSRSDTAEEITYKAKEMGFVVALAYPNHVIDPNTPLDASCFQGFGNFYGQNMMFHCSQVPNPKHVEVFVETCKKVLRGEYST